MKSGTPAPVLPGDIFEYPEMGLIKLSRCNDCAFTPGTEANLSNLTSHKASMCAMIGEPFFCHIGKEQKLCAGWVERVLTAEVAPSDVPEWKRKAIQSQLDFIQSFEERAQAGNLPSEEDLIQESTDALLASLGSTPDTERS